MPTVHTQYPLRRAMRALPAGFRDNMYEWSTSPPTPPSTAKAACCHSWSNTVLVDHCRRINHGITTRPMPSTVT
jgi:hypothetical protein